MVKFTIKNSILLDDLLKISEMAFGIRGFHPSISMLDDILAFELDIFDGDIFKPKNVFI